MADYYTFPSEEIIKTLAESTPLSMRPNHQPWALVHEGFLSSDTCEEIVEKYGDLQPYSFHRCNAETREIPRTFCPLLEPILEFTLEANDVFWGFDLDRTPTSWFQTYRKNQDYAQHMDGAPGQTRKLTSIVLLSKPSHYSGGELIFNVDPAWFQAPKTQGTVITFQHFLRHEVQRVTGGIRQTINMGFFGPPFR